MDRKIPRPPVRRYDQAAPIRAGKLRFPVAGPSALKKKGILGKSGNYFSKEAKEEVCLLLKVVRTTTGANRYVPLVGEEKVIWTWDEDTASALEKYLKTEPEGMCRHTAALVDNKDREIKNSHKGICTRTECIDTLGVTDLLMTFLKKSLSAEERNKRYEFILDNYPPTKEIVLFDPTLPEFHNKKLVIDGIEKKTMRHLLHSNGKQLWSFNIVYYTNSKLEEMKNMLRPLALTGMRKGTDRGFILKFVASDDKDALKDWWKDIIYHTKGLTSDDFHAENYDECDIEGMLQGLTSKLDAGNGIERFAPKTHSMTVGEGTEAYKKSFQTPLSMEDLMSLLIQTNNVTDTSSCLDSFLFSTNASGAEKLQVLVDPVNKADKILDRYGNNTQRMLLQAVTKEKLDTNVNLVPDFISNLSFFSFLKDMSVTTKSESLARYFDIQKSYVFKSEEEFCVSYLPSSESDYLGKLSSGGAKSSSIDQIILTVKKLAPSENTRSILVEGEKVTCINFNLFWEDQRRKVVDAYASVADINSCFPANIQAVKEREEKQIVSYLFNGYKENATVALLTLVEYFASLYMKNQLTYSNDHQVLGFLLQGVEATILSAQTMYLNDSAFHVLRKLINFSVSGQKMSNKIINSICDTYWRMYEEVKKKHKFTLLPDFMINTTLQFMKDVMNKHDNTPSAVLELCMFFINEGKLYKSSIHTPHATLLKAAIDDLVGQLHTVEIFHMTIAQERALRKIEQKTSDEVVEVPYILEHDVQNKNYKIRYCSHKAEDECIRLQKGKVKILASVKGIREETSRVLSILKIKNVLVDTGREVIADVTTLLKLGYNDVESFVNDVSRMLRAPQLQVQKACSLFYHAHEILIRFPSPNRSEVTVCAKGERSKLYGNAVAGSELGVNWGNDLLNNVGNGLTRFAHAI